MTSVVIPDSVTYIADYAFSYCDNLKSVSIPSTLTYFGDGAFYYCVQLQSEEYDGALYLGNKDNPYLILLHAEVTYGITECQVRDETKFIAGSAFENCKNLTEITFGAATQSIGSKAFSKCAALTSVTIPDTVTRLGERAFFECGALESAVIGSGVTKIETYSFYACRALKDVSLSASIERVSVAAFQGISDWALAEYDDVYYLGNDETPYLVVIGGSPSISSCTLHEQTKVLGDYAFNGFSRMKTVFVNRGLCFVGEGAFNGCQALTDIDFEGNETEWNGLAVHMSYNAPFFNATVEYNVR